MREGRGGAQGKGDRGRGEGGKAGMYLVIIPFSELGDVWENLGRKLREP